MGSVPDGSRTTPVSVVFPEPGHSGCDPGPLSPPSPRPPSSRLSGPISGPAPASEAPLSPASPAVTIGTTSGASTSSSVPHSAYVPVRMSTREDRSRGLQALPPRRRGGDVERRAGLPRFAELPLRSTIDDGLQLQMIFDAIDA